MSFKSFVNIPIQTVSINVAGITSLKENNALTVQFITFLISAIQNRAGLK